MANKCNYPIKSTGWSYITEKFRQVDKNPKKLEALLLLSESDLIKEVKFEWTWLEIDQYKDHNHLILEKEPRLKIVADAKTLIALSRERLCNKSPLETRMNWQHLLNLIAEIDPILVRACVPECIYRGFCPKMNHCPYIKTSVFKTQLEFYRTLPNHV